jgi:hypothetical protein
VVYTADQDTYSVDDLYSVSIGGGTVTKLNGNLVPGDRVQSFLISPDSRIVVYIASQDTVSEDLYSSGIDSDDDGSLTPF